MERTYRYGLITIIFVMLMGLLLFANGYHLTKQSTVDKIRKKDPLYQEIIYETSLDGANDVLIFRYNDIYYAPVVLNHGNQLWKVDNYFYEDITRMGMVTTGIDGIAYAFSSISNSQLNFLNLSLRKERDFFIVIDDTLESVILKNKQNEDVQAFDKIDHIFVLNTDLDAYSIVGLDGAGNVTKSRDIEYKYPSYINSIQLYGEPNVREFKNPRERPEIHFYMSGTGYDALPFVSEDMLEHPLMVLHVNNKQPVYLGNIDGTLKEYDGHKIFTYYQQDDEYILEVYRALDKSYSYYIIEPQTFNILKDDTMRLFYGS